MFDYIVNILKENHLAQGGLLIAAFSSILYSLKGLPVKLLTLLKRKCTSFIELDQKQAALQWMLVWLGDTEYGKKSKLLTVCDDDGNLTIGSGAHYLFRDKSLIIVHYSREYVETNGISMGLKQTLSLRAIPGNRKIIEDLLKEAKAKYITELENKIKVFMPNAWNEWRLVDTQPRTSIENVILASPVKALIDQALKRFRVSKEICEKYCTPWKLGILLHGPPGNGKTSLAKAIAGHLGYNIWILGLGGITSDKDLLELCSDIGQETILLIEDIDTYNIQRNKEKGQSLSLSGLLNALDGVTTKNGHITIMTTNHPERLDPAIIRAGRADFHIELAAPDKIQIQKLFDKFGVPYEGQHFNSMADAQGYILDELVAST